MPSNQNYIQQAEASLAGCLLVDPATAYRAISKIVVPSDIADSRARAVVSAAYALIQHGQAVDAVLVQAEAARQGAAVDGAYCEAVTQRYTTTDNAEETARVVREAAQGRASRAVGLALADGQIDAVDAMGRLRGIVQSGVASVQTPQAACMAVMDRISRAADGERPYIATGLQSLDAQLAGGLVLGGLYIVAGRPGMGKSTLGLCLADAVASQGKNVLYISLEMTSDQLWCCRLAATSGLSRSAIYAGTISNTDWPRLSDAADVLYSRPLYIRDQPSTLEDIEREARCLDDLEMIVVDHIGLIKARKGTASRYEVQSDISNALKQLALALKIPVIALCQLNRQTEQRDDHRPRVGELRDSGAIEQDADGVVLLYREAAYLPEDEAPAPWEDQDLEVIVGKNRHGATGTVHLGYNGMTSRIWDNRQAHYA